ncbi:hypothetical protein FRC02_003872 [Tulasnella sp. 418]|nr:hypothetical protein FRC02_003872 [Tulasnella sp. 418]
MTRLPPEGTHLIATMVGLAAYGVYNFLTGNVFLYLKQGRIRSQVITMALFMVWVCTTGAMAIKVTGVYMAFIVRGNTTGARAFFQEEYRSHGYLAAFKFVGYCNGVFADGLMCWRMYILWNRKWGVLIAPLTLLVGMIGSMITALIYELKNAASNGPYSQLERYWQLIALSQSLCVNILLTTLICWKIWRLAHTVSGLSPRSSHLYKHLIRVMAESGFIYTAFLIAFFTFRAAKLETEAIIITYVIPSVTGVMPTLVILRLFSKPEPLVNSTKDSGPVLSSIPSQSGTTAVPTPASGPSEIHLGALPQIDVELVVQSGESHSTLRQRRPEGVDPSDISDVRISLANCEPIELLPRTT